jgi:hypothetical protein
MAIPQKQSKDEPKNEGAQEKRARLGYSDKSHSNKANHDYQTDGVTRVFSGAVLSGGHNVELGRPGFARRWPA